MTVIFDTNGHGDAPKAVKVKAGGLVPDPGAPTAKGYKFGGWYADKECSADMKWDFSKDTAYNDFTLYAKWTKSGDNTVVIGAAIGIVAIIAVAGIIMYMRRP